MQHILVKLNIQQNKIVYIYNKNTIKDLHTQIHIFVIFYSKLIYM